MSNLLTPEEVGNLEWNSTDLWMLCVEDLKEKHPKEFKAVLEAQDAKSRKAVVEEIKKELENESYGDPRVSDWVRITYEDWCTFWERIK